MRSRDTVNIEEKTYINQPDRHAKQHTLTSSHHARPVVLFRWLIVVSLIRAIKQRYQIQARADETHFLPGN